MNRTIVTQGFFCLGSVMLMLLSTQGYADVQRAALISVGQASQPIGDLNGKLEALAYTNVSVNDEKKVMAWSLGYRHPLGKNWSADVQYLQQGKTEPTIQANPPLGKTDALAAKDAAEALPERGQGLSAIALYHRSITNNLSLQAGLGAVVWKSKRTATVGSSNYTAENDGVSAIVQLGVSYPLTKGAQVEAHWQHTFMPDEAVNRVGLGLAISF